MIASRESKTQIASCCVWVIVVAWEARKLRNQPVGARQA